MKSENKDTFALPQEVVRAAEILKTAGYEAYLIGGCVRDLLLDRKPKDWDITTNAKPEEIIAIFPKTFYENEFGTVGVVNEESADESLKVIEITPYRLESGYEDFRHPNVVTFSTKLDDDLARRDFTINAVALEIKERKNTNLYKGHLIDNYEGQKDLADRLIRTVGNPLQKFSEDALRMLRAVRIATELNFIIEENTISAIKEGSGLLDKIAKERIRDEFVRILLSENPANGLILSHNLGILKYISHEIENGIGIEQNLAHSYDVWEHSLRSLQHAADKGWTLELRLAAIFHDVAKPKTRKFSPETKWSFYGHEVVGARMTEKVLKNLKFPQKTIDKVVKLVRWHMFFSDTEKITLSAVRRLIANVGKENVWDLMNLRVADRVGTGRPKENPYRLRKYKSMVEEAMHDPVSVGMLKINGNRIMQVTHETSGPRIGHILHALFEEVIENPKLNTEEYLEGRTLKLAKFSDKELELLGGSGKEIIGEIERKTIKNIRDRYHVE